MNTRQVIITSGDDWVDASFTPVRVPDTMDMDEVYKEYTKWRKTTKGYKSFIEWLKENHLVTEENIEIFES